MYEISKSSAQRDVSGRSVIFRIFAEAMEVGGPNFMKCRKDVGKYGNENAPEHCQRHFSVVLGKRPIPNRFGQ